jgi:hemerythrin-like domain-containing protein
MFDHGRHGYIAREREVSGVPTRDQVRRLLAVGLDYRAVASRLGIPAGQAYLIGTGRPADGSVSTSDGQRDDLMTGSQRLANPPAENPTGGETVRDWIAARVAADPSMRAASARRGVQPPAIAEPDAANDVVTVLNRDHNQLKYLLKELQATPGQASGGTKEHLARRRSIVSAIADRVSRHEAVEQAHFWPVVRSVLSDGDSCADEGLRQEQEGKDTVTTLVGLAPDSDEFDEQVAQLVQRLGRHVAFEDTVFLRLRAAMSPEDLDALGRRLLTEGETTQGEAEGKS